MITLPAKVRVGAMVYDVIAIKDLPDLGLCDEEKCCIAIREGLPDDVATVTLWHELIHAMLYALGYRRHSERMVDGIAYQITQLLQDNPALRGP